MSYVPRDPRRVRDIPKQEAVSILCRAGKGALRYLETPRRADHKWKWHPVTRFRVGPVSAIAVDLGNGRTAALLYVVGEVRDHMTANILRAEEIDTREPKTRNGAARAQARA